MQAAWLLRKERLDVEKSIPIGETSQIVEILKPLSSEDRSRVIRAAMVLLGDLGSYPQTSDAEGASNIKVDNAVMFPPRAQGWMKQNGITESQVLQIFHIADGTAEVIAVHVPGRNKKEQTYSCYILTGLGQFLLTGTATFQDKTARALCDSTGCYDSANHAAHLKDRGNEFTGSKERGWTLTTPGLKRAAEIIRELALI
jgi:hypothetical protein